MERLNQYPHRINARLDDADFATLKDIARKVRTIGHPSLTEAIRFLINQWRRG